MLRFNIREILEMSGMMIMNTNKIEIISTAEKTILLSNQQNQIVAILNNNVLLNCLPSWRNCKNIKPGQLKSKYDKLRKWDHEKKNDNNFKS